MKTIAPVILAAATYFAAPSHSLPVYWVDWQTGTPGLNGSASGVIQLGGQTIEVNYSGEASFIQTDGDKNYWVPAGPYVSGAVDNPPPDSDIIATSQTSLKTLTFSQPVNNLFFAIVSLNFNGYFFNEPFDVVSYGEGYWGDGWFQEIVTANGEQVVWGTWEGHGVIRFDNPVQSLSWRTYEDEYWNGFTVGTYGLVIGALPAPVATPDGGSSAVLLGAGLGALLFARRTWSRQS